MKERPILFRAPMVRALLAGTKTQTRRVMKPQPSRVDGGVPFGDAPAWACANPGSAMMRCPYGKRGDRLWVREAWAPDPLNDGTWEYTSWAGCKDGQIAGVPERFRHSRYCNYAADWLHGPIIWKLGIHMPRWASRITLEITGVRVERLQDISEADAKAEGVGQVGIETGAVLSSSAPVEIVSYCAAYCDLWEQINGAGSWDANPWVWVVEFRRAK